MCFVLVFLLLFSTFTGIMPVFAHVYQNEIGDIKEIPFIVNEEQGFIEENTLYECRNNWYDKYVNHFAEDYWGEYGIRDAASITASSIDPLSLLFTPISQMNYFTVWPRAGRGDNGWLLNNGNKRIVSETWQDNTGSTHLNGGIIAGNYGISETNTNWTNGGSANANGRSSAQNRANGHTIAYLLNGNYHRFTGTIALNWNSRDAQRNYMIRVWGDSYRILYESPIISGGTLPFSFDIDVRGVNQVRIERIADGNAAIAIVNAGFHRNPTASLPPTQPLQPVIMPDTHLSRIDYASLSPAAGRGNNGWALNNGNRRLVDTSWRDNVGNMYAYGGIIAGNSGISETNTNWTDGGSTNANGRSGAQNRADFHVITYSLARQYTRFTGTVALSWNSRDAQSWYWITIWGDNTILYTTRPLTGGSVPVNFDVNVTDVELLRIERRAGGNAAIAIVNAGFHLSGVPPIPSSPITYLSQMDWFTMSPASGRGGNGWAWNTGTQRSVWTHEPQWPIWRDNLGNIYPNGGIIAGNSITTETNTNWTNGGSANANGRSGAQNRANNHSISYLLNGNYMRFTGTLALTWNSRNALQNYQIQFWGDSALIYTSPIITGGTHPISFDVDVTGVTQLQIVRLAGGNAEVALFDAAFHRSPSVPVPMPYAPPPPNRSPYLVPDVLLAEMDYFMLMPAAGCGLNGWVLNNGTRRVIGPTWRPFRDNAGNIYTYMGILAGNSGTTETNTNWTDGGSANANGRNGAQNRANGHSITYLINSRYQRFSGTIALSWANRDAQLNYQIRVWGDDIVLYTSPIITGGVLPIDFDIDVTGVTQLRIERLAGGNAVVALMNAGFHRQATHSVIPVASIINVLTTGIAGTPVTLGGIVQPSNATNQTIVWSLGSGSTAPGASVIAGQAHATGAGTVIATAAITNGTGAGINFIQNFTINFATATPPQRDGWVEIDGDQFFYISNVRQTDWMDVGERRIFLNPETNGAMATGVVATSHQGVHEFGLDGIWIRQIHNYNWTAGFEFFYIDGARHTGWLQSGARRIFFIPEASSALATGIISTNTHGVHEFTQDGFWIRQIHNFHWTDGFEFFYIDGARHTGWLQVADRRIFFIPEAASTLATGVISTSTHGIHEFTADGFWIRQIHNANWNGAFFYVDGVRHLGWLRSAGNRLYLHPSLGGAIATGTIVITNGETHEFAANGHWIRRIL